MIKALPKVSQTISKSGLQRLANNILFIGMKNSKTGPAFSIPHGVTCPGRTETCASLCYVTTGKMNLPVAHRSRDTQLKVVLALLRAGLFAQKLSATIQASSIRTLRIHDSGDFMSPAYTRAWFQACKQLKSTQFWAYTRSFVIPGILLELVKLSKLKNVAIWISADKDNWLKAVSTYREYPSFAGIAFMETKDDQEISQALAGMLPRKNLVVFPIHGHFGRLTHVPTDSVPNCPAVTKQIPHDETFPACLRCLKCLPNYRGDY